MNRSGKGFFTRRTSALAHAAKARRRMEQPVMNELVRVPDGLLIGVLQWTDARGVVRVWECRQGPRANNLRVRAQGKEVICGFDHLLRSLRKRLAVVRRVTRGDPCAM